MGAVSRRGPRPVSRVRARFGDGRDGAAVASFGRLAARWLPCARRVFGWWARPRPPRGAASPPFRAHETPTHPPSRNTDQGVQPECESLGGNPKGAWKQNAGPRRSLAGAPQDRPILLYGKRFEYEHSRCDPKGCELCVTRAKPRETLVEARRDSNVQIDLKSCV